VKLSCAFATSLETPHHVRIAEELGYQRAFFYDSPALYPDVWVQLCRTADLTERIVLGPGVLIPSLRHPMVTAAAISTLVYAAGLERVVVGIGSGFTGRYALGKPPVPWAYVRDYALTVQALLRGEQAEWDGAITQMIHPDTRFAPPRPITVPWVVAGQGPKGLAVARDLNAGVLSITNANPDFESNTVMVPGTVLDQDEDAGSDRVIDAAGGAAALYLHWAVEHGVLEEMLGEGGRLWAAAYDAVPQNVRHLALHDRHVVGVNDHDRPFVNGDLMMASDVALTVKQWRDKLADFQSAGCTEVAYQPAGHDIPRELEAFAAAFHADIQTEQGQL
jgi:5,10-methylenetetrahydromethanopterin reductase